MPQFFDRSPELQYVFLINCGGNGVEGTSIEPWDAGSPDSELARVNEQRMGAIMNNRLMSALFGGLFVSLVSSGALAQIASPPPPPPAPAEVSDAPPETAFLLQARMQTQQSLLSAVGASPGFLVGVQLKSVAIGLGVGFNRVGATIDSSGDKISASLFQVAPVILVDVWQSRDQRTRANLVGSVGYGKASVSSTSSSSVCTIDALGNQTCSTSLSESKSSATLIPVQIGFGGDHYLSRHFGIGAEAGVQLMFISGLEIEWSERNWKRQYPVVLRTVADVVADWGVRVARPSRGAAYISHFVLVLATRSNLRVTTPAASSS